MFIPSDGLVLDLNPTVDTSIYASGDVLTTPVEMANSVLNTKGLAYLRSLLIIDGSNQKSALDVLFFNQDPGSIGARNAALSLSSSQIDMLIGMVSVAGADYTTLTAATNALAVKTPNLMMPAIQKSKSFWMAIVSRGTPTYGAATSLRIKAILERQS